MNYEKLKELLRSEYNNKIIPLVKKKACENCGSEEKLVVHHNPAFKNQLDDTLKFFNISENNIGEIDEKLLCLIKDRMLSSQIRNENITLCEYCHKDKHRCKVTNRVIYNHNFYLKQMIRAELDDIINESIKQRLIPLLESIRVEGMNEEYKKDIKYMVKGIFEKCYDDKKDIIDYKKLNRQLGKYTDKYIICENSVELNPKRHLTWEENTERINRKLNEILCKSN